MYSEEGWRPNEAWDRKVLNDYKEIAGWQPVNPIGALSFINFIADAILKELIDAGGVMLADDQTSPKSSGCSCQDCKDARFLIQQAWEDAGFKKVKSIVKKIEEGTDGKT